MVRGIGKLRFGKRTGMYFWLLILFYILVTYFVPIGMVIGLGFLLYDLPRFIGIVWLSYLFIFSFRTNPTFYRVFIQWFSLIALIVLLIAGSFRYSGNRLNVELDRNGITTLAMVLDKEIRSGKSTPITFELDVVYYLEDGQYRRRTIKTNEEYYHQIRVNDPITIRYSRLHPKLIRIQYQE